MSSVVPTPLTSVSSNAQHGSTSSDHTFRKSATFTRHSGSRADGRGSIVVHTSTFDQSSTFIILLSSSLQTKPLGKPRSPVSSSLSVNLTGALVVPYKQLN
ncbi:uncharacterized protein PGTG_09783 [Puccinia graminis f. sp. tritici CRL 75-36-700-3]|uniref:Uncharacterized protein n=1 Tax=Puccinia graminis f. sp. tritici (strain CRL 75-36-700-3 / race SCCL) TaxID=418459 RepID=E3KEU0_PUCGT|nr:uncharacterized protein PGTG_09783 [Puccinia graminis f. sp. tritici CRL 75-36-700-3]EFP82815.2 hypothetical protein PGTG_09783 [Puccinia graminis f. sp. tritici CRL 75-36-700-3]